MIGAIAGDIIGSPYEARPIKSKEFPLFTTGADFTDDTVLTVATAQVLLKGGDYAGAYRAYYRRHRERGYGAAFRRWAERAAAPAYGSYGNGSAMRVCPIGWAYESLEEVRREAARSAEVSHNHPEGIKGAQAVASAVFLARTGHDRAGIAATLARLHGYDLGRRLEQIRPGYRFDVSCQGSVPEAIIAFLQSVDYEDAVRNAVSLGGDSDTMACIAGGIAEAFYGGVPKAIRTTALARLSPDLAGVVDAFRTRYGLP